MNKKLGKQEWVEAGLRALSEQGIDKVRVEKLAEMLCITKGSFYWHFKNRQELLTALLEAWQLRATNEVIEAVERRGGDARSRLLSLFMIVMESDGRLDMAIRAWGAKEADVLKAVEHIDRRRLAYLQSLFEELGFSSAQARARSGLSYHALIGQYAMGVRVGPEDLRSAQFEIVFDLLTDAHSV